MAKFIIYLFVFFSFSSCINDSKCKEAKNESGCGALTKNDIGKHCSAYVLELNKPISNISRYYIWRKYSVILHMSIDADEISHDSCIIIKSYQYYITQLGISTINKIYSDIDSLYELEHEKVQGVKFNVFDQYNLKYYDGKYSDYLISLRDYTLNRDTINCQPLPKNDSLYKKVFDDLWTIFRKDRVKSNLIYFWYVIDKQGHLKEIEVMNQNCSDSVENTLFNQLQRIEWFPAVYEGNSVEYRGHDFF